MRSNLPALGAAMLVALLWATAAAADDDKIVTDRPDAVESSDTVGPGRFQLETSVAGNWTRREQASGLRRKNTSMPTLLRYGVGDKFELRLETDGRVATRARGDEGAESARGWADASVGFKWKQQDGDPKAGKPDLAWLGHIDLPTGSRAFRGTGTRPSLRMVLEFDLPGDVAIGIMPGIALDKRADGKREASGIFAAVIGKEWTDKVRTFAEIAMPRIATMRNGGNVMLLDLGIDYWIEKQIKVDFMIQRGLNKNSPDWGATAGFSIKF